MGGGRLRPAFLNAAPELNDHHDNDRKLEAQILRCEAAVEFLFGARVKCSGPTELTRDAVDIFGPKPRAAIFRSGGN